MLNVVAVVNTQCEERISERKGRFGSAFVCLRGGGLKKYILNAPTGM
jgi:hypothetical protein